MKNAIALAVLLTYGCASNPVKPTIMEARSYQCRPIVLSNHRECMECFYGVEQSERPHIRCGRPNKWAAWR